MPNIKFKDNNQIYSWLIEENTQVTLSSSNQKFCLGSFLGHGSYGAVFRPTLGNINEGQNFLIKIVFQGSKNDTDIQTQISSEVARWLQYDPANMNNFSEYGQTPLQVKVESNGNAVTAKGYVMPYYPGKTLFNYLINHPGQVEADDIIKILLAILQEYQTLAFVHNDFHANNIIINKTAEQYQVKFIDFGLAEESNDEYNACWDIKSLLKNFYIRRELYKLNFSKSLLYFFEFYLTQEKFELSNIATNLKLLLHFKNETGRVLFAKIETGLNNEDFPKLEKIDNRYQTTKIREVLCNVDERYLKKICSGNPNKRYLLYLFTYKFHRTLRNLIADEVIRIINNYHHFFKNIEKIWNSNHPDKYTLLYTYCRREIIQYSYKSLSQDGVDLTNVIPGVGVNAALKILQSENEPSLKLFQFFKSLLEELIKNNFNNFDVNYIFITNNPVAVKIVDFHYDLTGQKFLESFQLLLNYINIEIRSKKYQYPQSFVSFVKLCADSSFSSTDKIKLYAVLSSALTLENDQQRDLYFRRKLIINKINQLCDEKLTHYFNNNILLSYRKNLFDIVGSNNFTAYEEGLLSLVDILSDEGLQKNLGSVNQSQRDEFIKILQEKLIHLMNFLKKPWFNHDNNLNKIKTYFNRLISNDLSVILHLEKLNCYVLDQHYQAFQTNLDLTIHSDLNHAEKMNMLKLIVEYQPIWNICRYLKTLLTAQKKPKKSSCFNFFRKAPDTAGTTFDFGNELANQLFKHYSNPNFHENMEYYTSFSTALIIEAEKALHEKLIGLLTPALTPNATSDLNTLTPRY
ncbi:MAG: protein kinase family protein [Legionellales bacterium]|nr:protein kinase family protein [Legionellales bacterium]